MTNVQIVEAVLNNIIKDIITDQEAKNLSASGKSAKSLEVIMDEDGGQLIGDQSFYYQVHGRGPGKFPPPPNILDWVETKIFPTDIKPESLAYLIGRKIATSGTAIWRGEREGLALDGIVQENLDFLMERLADNQVEKVMNLFNNIK